MRPRIQLVIAWSAIISMMAAGGLTSCLEEPGVGEDYEEPLFKHALVSGEACSSCHSDVKPAAIENHPHGGDKECSTCHTSKDDNSGWLPRIAFNHEPKPASCLDCHVQQRPQRDSHPQTGECAGCHNYPSFK